MENYSTNSISCHPFQFFSLNFQPSRRFQRLSCPSLAAPSRYSTRKIISSFLSGLPIKFLGKVRMRPHQNQDRHSLKIPVLEQENSSTGFPVFIITNHTRGLSMSKLHFASHCPNSSLKHIINPINY